MPADKKIDYKNALNRAAALCSRNEQCSSQIREKLERWEVAEKDRESIIMELSKEKFLDDRRYAHFYVKDKFRLNGWGRVKIRTMLRQKQIDSELIEEALLLIDRDEYMERCTDLLRRKAAGLKEEDPYKRKAKLIRFAAGRGFESGMIFDILGDLEKGE